MADEPKIFTASRLTEGNRVFPAEIKIDHIGVTIKEPGLFSDSEKTIPFSRIASVDIDCPLVGFSSITLETTGEDSQRINGFTQDEAREMKELILKKI
jgi:membrane protein YdbS with pleckstrin-like domain